MSFFFVLLENLRFCEKLLKQKLEIFNYLQLLYLTFFYKKSNFVGKHENRSAPLWATPTSSSGPRGEAQKYLLLLLLQLSAD